MKSVCNLCIVARVEPFWLSSQSIITINNIFVENSLRTWKMGLKRSSVYAYSEPENTTAPASYGFVVWFSVITKLRASCWFMQMCEHSVFGNEIYATDCPHRQCLCVCPRTESVRDNFNGLLEKFKIISLWIGVWGDGGERESENRALLWLGNTWIYLYGSSNWHPHTTISPWC